MISIIAAISENNVIGDNNKLIWNIPDDLRRFKNLTVGHPVVMGRKTFESIGHALPKRRNVVITRQAISIPDCIVVHSVEEAIELFPSSTEVMIIGGGEIYRQALPYATRMYITRVHHSFQGDTKFPDVNWNAWDKILEDSTFVPTESVPYKYSFEIYERVL